MAMVVQQHVDVTLLSEAAGETDLNSDRNASCFNRNLIP
jgi:hypothetical protein